MPIIKSNNFSNFQPVAIIYYQNRFWAFFGIQISSHCLLLEFMNHETFHLATIIGPQAKILPLLFFLVNGCRLTEKKWYWFSPRFLTTFRLELFPLPDCNWRGFCLAADSRKKTKSKFLFVDGNSTFNFSAKMQEGNKTFSTNHSP